MTFSRTSRDSPFLGVRLQRDPDDLDQMSDERAQTCQVRAQLAAVPRASQSDRQVAETRDHVTQLLHHLCRRRAVKRTLALLTVLTGPTVHGSLLLQIIYIAGITYLQVFYNRLTDLAGYLHSTCTYLLAENCSLPIAV